VITVSCINHARNLDNSKIIYVYNPSEDQIKIKIDNDEITLPPMNTFPIQLIYGTHFFEFGELKDSFQLDTSTNIVINPLRDTLILEEILYVPNDKKENEFTDKDYNIEFSMLIIDNLKYYGPFELTNDLILSDWAYGPWHPVNLQLTEFSYIKPVLDTIFFVKKLYNIKEFIENYTSINHTEEYIEEILPRFLKILSNEIIVDIRGDALYAGTAGNVIELADIHVTPDEKLYLTLWEKFDKSIHGEMEEIKFIINDCTVEIDDSIIYGNEIHGISVSKSEFIVLAVK